MAGLEDILGRELKQQSGTSAAVQVVVDAVTPQGEVPSTEELAAKIGG